MTPEFQYQDLFTGDDDPADYRLLSHDYVRIREFEGERIVKIEPEGLTLLAEEAFRDVSHLLRSSHLRQMADILEDPEASDNDRYVALEMIKNAVISAEEVAGWSETNNYETVTMLLPRAPRVYVNG